MKSNRGYISWILVSIFSIAMIASFQNCTQTKFSDFPVEFQKNLASGNGGPYGGKPGVFRHFSDQRPCTELDRNGKSLPNNVILIRPNDQGILAPFLARRDCRDISPIEISSNDIQFNATDNAIIYQNQNFSTQNLPGDFDLVAANCPVGQSLIPDALRVNGFASSLDWTSLQNNSSGLWTPGWYNFPGIGVGLYSTLSSLPAYQILRDDSNLLDEWRRASQHVYLKANTEYSFTFLARPGTVSAADFTFYRGWTGIPGDPRNEEAVLTFDFSSQTVQTLRISNVSNVRATISPFGNGFICTVYWTTSDTGDQGESNIGLTPSARGQANGGVGDSIIATAAQLVPVSDFCR